MDILAYATIFLLFAVILLIIYYQVKIRDIKVKIEKEAKEKFKEWVEAYSAELQKKIEESTNQKYESLLEKWKIEEEKKIRRDAIKRSINTIMGSVGEEFSPLLLMEELEINPKDFRHIGSPVDFIAFKGLSEGEVTEVLFIEIKSSKNPTITDREKSLKEALDNKKVRYVIKDISKSMENFKNSLDKFDMQ